MEEDYYIALLEKRLAGRLDAAEERELADWRAASPANERTARSVELAWRATAPAEAPASTDADAAFAALSARIDAAERADAKTVDLPRRNRWWAAAAAVLLLAVAGTYWLSRTDNAGTDAYTQVETQADGRLVSLADGSRVHLNETSRLRFPQTFDGTERRVLLEGEAYFEVERREDQPFVVATEQGEITVLGTTFNVRAYATGAATQVFVASGRVRVATIQGTTPAIVLTEGQAATIDHADGRLQRDGAASANALSWYSGELIFEDTPLPEAVRQIEALSGPRFVLDNDALRACPLDARFDRDQPARFLEDLQTILNVTIEQTADGIYHLRGGAC